MAAPAPSAAPGSPQPPARPLPATCAGRGITARFPAACGHTGRALPSLLRGGGRVGPDRTRTSPATCGRGRARAGAGESLSLWLAARRGAAGRGGRAAPSARRAAGGERPPVPGRREASRAESSQAESSVCGGRHPPREGRGTRRHGAARGEGALPAPAPPAAASR